jgi:hypothetical protein
VPKFYNRYTANRLLGVETWRFGDLKTWVEDLRSYKGNVVWPEEELEDCRLCKSEIV